MENNMPRSTKGSLEINKYILEYLCDKKLDDSFLGLSLSFAGLIFTIIGRQNSVVPDEMFLDEFIKEMSIDIKKGYNYLKECEKEEQLEDKVGNILREE